MLLASSLAVASKAGVELSALVVVGVPLAVGAFAWWWLRHRPAAALVGDPAAEAVGADPAAPSAQQPARLAASDRPATTPDPVASASDPG